MANAALQNMGTLLRHTNAEIQRIIPRKPGEEETIPAVQQTADAVVAALNRLGVGSSPDADNNEVSPSPLFLSLSKNVTLSAMMRLNDLQEADVPGQFDDFKALKERIKDLDGALALAMGRRP